MKNTMKIIIYSILAVIFIKLYFSFLEQRMLFPADNDVSYTPAEFGLDYEDAMFKSPDGNILYGWFVPAKNASITLIYYHGNGGNISHRLHRADFFHDLGINFFIFDYRGYGKSKGKPSEKGLYKDALAAYDYAVKLKEVKGTKIVIYGKSLGGPIASEVCSNRKADALILESSLASVEMRAYEMFPFLPMKYLTTQKFDTVKKVKSITIPKLITHGKRDKVVSFRHGEAIFENSAEKKEFLPFEGGHNDEIFVTSKEFKVALKKFLEENLDQ